MDEQLEERIDRFGRTLAELQAELAELRRMAAASPAPEPLRPRVPEPPTQAVVAAPAPERAVERRETRRERPQVRVADLLGARALAWSGGAVTLLGVVLLFALAVNRGWIGPWERCGIGFAASAFVFVGGLWLRRRYGTTYSALAAVGAGIGGAYASLLAAGALYHLVPGWAALVVAAIIASLGVATSIAWSAELVAGLGMVGAMIVPVAVAFDGGLTTLRTGFVTIVLAATGVVAVRLRWSRLLVVGVAASLPQIAALVWQAAPGSASATVLAAVFGLLYLGLAAAWQLRHGPALRSLPGSLAVLAAVLGAASARHLFDGADEGLALLVVAGTYGAAAAAFLARRTQRDLSSALWAIGLAVGVVAHADLVGGSVLAIGWAAEAVVLAWLAQRVREPRFQLGALAYLALAVGHSLVLDAPLGHLFVARAHPATGALAIVGAAVAAAVTALYARRQEEPPPAGLFRVLEPFFVSLRACQPALREALLWAGGALATYAASLGILELAEAAGAYSPGAFDWGQVPVSALWALLAAALLVLGAARRSGHLTYGGAVLLGAVLAKSLLYDLVYVGDPAGLYAALAVGAIVLLGGYLYGRDRGLGALPVAAVLASALLLVIAVDGLVGGALAGIDVGGAAHFGVGAVYALLAASIFRRGRDLGTLLWATGLVVLLGAWSELLSGTPLVLAWAGTGAVLAWLGSRTGEPRLHLGAAGAIGPALVWTLATEAQPRDLFVAGPSPGHGALALAGVAIAAGLLGHYGASAPAREAPKDAWPWLFFALDRLARQSAGWLAGIAGVAAISLSILQLFQWGGAGSVHLEFQHGHTAVSAFWGTLGLAVLYLGLTRDSRQLRLAGFATFGISLAKIFLYDLAALSSITRALSFLAVGAVLLLGGFFYQRLSSQLGERHARPG